jgi:Flp pilus assembly CpaE family ATPase
VINRIGQPKELPLKLIEEALGVEVSFQIADDPVAMNEAINLGVPLAGAFPKSKAAIGVSQLADHLTGVCKEKSPNLLRRGWLPQRPLTLTLRSAARLLESINL